MVVVDVDVVAFDSSVDLSMAQEGLSVTVRSGDIVWRGESFVLVEDETYEVPQRSVDIGVVGYLVLEDESRLHVLVDTYEAGKDSVPFDFADWPQYRLLTHLFLFTAPAGVGSLDEVEVKRIRVVAPPSSEVS